MPNLYGHTALRLYVHTGQYERERLDGENCRYTWWIDGLSRACIHSFAHYSIIMLYSVELEIIQCSQLLMTAVWAL